MGALDFLFGGIDDLLNKPSAIQKKPPAPPAAPPARAEAPRKKAPEEKYVVQMPPQMPPSAGLDLSGLIGGYGGKQRDPMPVDEFKAIMAAIQRAAGNPPPVPDFSIFNHPLDQGEMPLDMRPLAAWIDSQTGSKYLPGTPDLPGEYMLRAKQLREAATGGPAIEQAKAQAMGELYKSQLKKLSADEIVKYIAPVTGRGGLTLGGLTLGGPALAKDVATGAAALAASGIPVAASGSAKSPSLNLNPAQAISVAKEQKRIKDEDAANAFQVKKATFELGGKLSEQAIKDPLIQKYTDTILPNAGIARAQLLNDNSGGLGSLAAIQTFQKLIEAFAVHESDIKNIQRMQGLSNQLEGFVNSLRGGSTLGTDARMEMVRVIADMEEQWRQSAMNKLKTYKRQGAAQGVQPGVLEESVGKALAPRKIHMITIDPKTKQKREYDISSEDRADFVKEMKGKKMEVREGGH